ncbi:MAG: malonyl CoA-ACP transacylase [Spirochaetae bacterium HGW-Spirochaetae-3]|jgi:[acyl-carrier-protein] S-malonyltransferase|nr:MAG: malonyl CoA-ACP transacylase [Spirochaetae bacterium HGW-Spirochaetae-3]
MKTCILFPGQGAQSIGMGKDLYDADRDVRGLFEEASDISGSDLAALIFSGSEDDLKQTRNAQLAIALIDSAASLALRKRGVRADGAAGFSLGEWAALAEARVVTFGEMIRLVAERGRLMDEAGRRSGGSSMSAVLGLQPAAIEAALESAGIEDAWIANYNAPGQSVLSGTESGLAAAEDAVKAAGAKRAIRLKVSGAFHSPIMRYAYDGFKELLTDVAFADPAIAFYSNVTGARVATGAELRSLAAEQIISPVRWIDEEKAILDDGYDRLLEAGPGTVLAGLWKSAGLEPAVVPAGKVEQIEAVSA